LDEIYATRGNTKFNFIICNADMTVTQNSEVDVTLMSLNACF